MLSRLAGGDAGLRCLPIGPKPGEAATFLVGIELELQAESCSVAVFFSAVRWKRLCMGKPGGAHEGSRRGAPGQ
jgi:hypothetical protein